MSGILLLPIFLPIIAGLVVFGIRRWSWAISLGASALTLILSIIIFLGGTIRFGRDILSWNGIDIRFSLKSYDFASIVLVSAAFFSLLIIIYSLRYMEKFRALHLYYGNILMALGSASGVMLAGDLITLLIFWIISGLVLHSLLNSGGAGSEGASRKISAVIGGTDLLMVLGVGMIWHLTKTFDMSLIRLPLQGWLEVTAFLLLVAGSFAKTGAIPFGSWIPESSRYAPVPVMALLPASLDKLMGIYLLVRISLDLFPVVPNSFFSLLLLAVGSLTIVTAVFAALIQHDLKKLLSFHTVSQVGYMIVGIGTGIPIGIAGGIFHMLNNAIYKSCLFLASGAVIRETGTADLDDLGGLARAMPVTFASTLIASLAISGIPPLNGFVSKWMIYQSLVELGGGGNPLWIIWLLAAMFGSAATLASFLKILNAVFMGEPKSSRRAAHEAPFSMWLPMATLALICVVFGIFAFAIPLKYFILPAVPSVLFLGFWSPVLAAVLLLVGLGIGCVIYLFGMRRPMRQTPPFISGETIAPEKLRVTGSRFFDDLPI